MRTSTLLALAASTVVTTPVLASSAPVITAAPEVNVTAREEQAADRVTFDKFQQSLIGMVTKYSQPPAKVCMLLISTAMPS